MNGVGVHWRQAVRGARRPFLFLAAMLALVLLLGAGCPSATGPAKRISEPPRRPFVGTIYGFLTVWRGSGRVQQDSFRVVFPDTLTARFSWLRNGRFTPETTERVHDLPSWNDDGGPAATPGVALDVSWPAPGSRYPILLDMWGYYSGGGLSVEFVGRARKAEPQGDTLMISYPGIWSAKVARQ